MRDCLFRKGLVLAIIILFIGMSIFPSTAIDTVKTFMPTNNGNTLYVGGDGEGNYTRIQDAIVDAVDGDTVFVYNESSPYYEHFIIDKSISLIGENRDTTVIDGSKSGTVVKVFADGVTVSGFTIQNSGEGLNEAGVDIRSNFNTITGNTISNNDPYAIYFYDSDSNTITGNTILNNNYVGIKLKSSSDNNFIYHNNFINNWHNAVDECDNTWDDGEYGNYWSDYKRKNPLARKIWLKGIWNTPYEIYNGDNEDRFPLIKQWPNSKPRTISRNRAINTPFLNFLESHPNLFPILRHLLRL